MLNIDQHDTVHTLNGFEYDGVGTVTVNGATSSFTGFLDLNIDLVPTPGTVGDVSGTFNANANGVFAGTVAGISSIGAPYCPFTFYLIGASSGPSVGVIGIEADNGDQITLATFELQ